MSVNCTCCPNRAWVESHSGQVDLFVRRGERAPECDATPETGITLTRESAKALILDLMGAFDIREVQASGTRTLFIEKVS